MFFIGCLLGSLIGCLIGCLFGLSVTKKIEHYALDFYLFLWVFIFCSNLCFYGCFILCSNLCFYGCFILCSKMLQLVVCSRTTFPGRVHRLDHQCYCCIRSHNHIVALLLRRKSRHPPSCD